MADTGKAEIIYDRPSVKDKAPGATITTKDNFVVQAFSKQTQIHLYLVCLIRADGRPATTNPELLVGPASPDPEEPLLSQELRLEAGLTSGEEVTAFFNYILNGKEHMDDSEVKALKDAFKKHVQEGKSVKDFAKGNKFEGDKYRVGL